MKTKKDTNFYNETVRHGVKTMRFNREELTVLDEMMRKEGWENACGFIKYRLFGLTVRDKYRRILQSRDREDAESALERLVEDLFGRLEYAGYRYDEDSHKLAVEVRKNGGMWDRKTVLRKLSLLHKWNEDVMRAVAAVEDDIALMMTTMGLNVPQKDEDYYHNLPDYVLDRVKQDWNNTTTPEAQERARRFAERWEREHGRTLDGMPLEKVKELQEKNRKNENEQ